MAVRWGGGEIGGEQLSQVGELNEFPPVSPHPPPYVATHFGIWHSPRRALPLRVARDVDAQAFPFQRSVGSFSRRGHPPGGSQQLPDEVQDPSPGRLKESLGRLTPKIKFWVRITMVFRNCVSNGREMVFSRGLGIFFAFL